MNLRSAGTDTEEKVVSAVSHSTLLWVNAGN